MGRRGKGAVWGRAGADRSQVAPSGGIGAVGRRRWCCGKVCIGGGGRWGGERGMCEGGVGTLCLSQAA